MRYNFFAAIELRSEGIYDDVRGIQQPVDFKTSVDLVKSTDFMWGWGYPGEPFIQAKVARDRGEQVTKEIWKNWQRGYRTWIRSSVNESAQSFE